MIGRLNKEVLSQKPHHSSSLSNPASMPGFPLQHHELFSSEEHTDILSLNWRMKLSLEQMRQMLQYFSVTSMSFWLLMHPQTLTIEIGWRPQLAPIGSSDYIHCGLWLFRKLMWRQNHFRRLVWGLFLAFHRYSRNLWLDVGVTSRLHKSSRPFKVLCLSCSSEIMSNTVIVFWYLCCLYQWCPISLTASWQMGQWFYMRDF